MMLEASMKELTVREAVSLSRLTRQQVYNLVVNGRVLARKDGSEYRIDRGSLLRYMQRRRSRNKQQPAQPAT